MWQFWAFLMAILGFRCSISFFLETNSAHGILCQVCDVFLASEWPCTVIIVIIMMNQPSVHEKVERHP